jgi:hypothetical protein
MVAGPGRHGGMQTMRRELGAARRPARSPSGDGSWSRSAVDALRDRDRDRWGVAVRVRFSSLGTSAAPG